MNYFELMKYTGQYAPLSKNLWRMDDEFRRSVDLLILGQSVKLQIDDAVSFLKCASPIGRSVGFNQSLALLMFPVPFSGVYYTTLVI